MSENPLVRLQAFGQSVWSDFIQRGMLISGEFQRLIDEDGLRGVTSNPAIFEKAIDGSQDYDEAIRHLARQGLRTEGIYEVLAVEDIQRAADLFRGLYDQTQGGDGYVSLEVSPTLARETDKTVAAARRLWKYVNRPNVMIKIPGTAEGLPAIRQCLAEGINVNVTLLFGLKRYREVIEAYLGGLETRLAQGEPLPSVASVASFFLSRIDVLLDPVLTAARSAGGERATLAARVQGQVAIASAKLAYAIYREVFGASRFQALARRGARPQRLLWASTSTKNPAESDVKYVEPLIGPETVNTMPPETLEAYRRHGQPAARLTEGVAEARQLLAQLDELSIDLDATAQQLEQEGIEKFIKPYRTLLLTIDTKRAAALDRAIA